MSPMRYLLLLSGVLLAGGLTVLIGAALAPRLDHPGGAALAMIAALVAVVVLRVIARRPRGGR